MQINLLRKKKQEKERKEPFQDLSQFALLEQTKGYGTVEKDWLHDLEFDRRGDCEREFDNSLDIDDPDIDMGPVIRPGGQRLLSANTRFENISIYGVDRRKLAIY